jgi:heat shock protein HslJ
MSGPAGKAGPDPVGREAVMRSLLLSGFLASVALAAMAAPAGLIGKWRIVAIEGAQDFDTSKSVAEFSGDRFASTIGCNRIAGAPKIKGAELNFGALATTRMACPPPLDALERHYLAALAAARGYRIDAKTLFFVDAKGAALVTLERE